MNNLSKTFVAAMVALATNTAWAAAMLDGEQELICSTAKAYDCAVTDCLEAVPANIGAPRFFTIDFKNGKMIPSAYEEIQQPTQIKRVEIIDGKLILQGAEDGFEGTQDGLGWSLAIVQANGNMIFSASGDDEAFVLFGNCIPK